MKTWWKENQPSVMGSLVAPIAVALGKSLRLHIEGMDETFAIPGGKIYLLWHGRTIVPGYTFGKKGLWVIISHSNDGDIQTKVLSRLGYQVIRGSTGRGGERALVESIRCLKSGGSMAITPDGPRGPSGVVQGGVMTMAKKARVPLIPVGISAGPRKLIRAWDQHLVPYPFARAEIIGGKPIYIPPEANADEVEAIRLLVQSELHRLQNEAELRLGFKVSDEQMQKGAWLASKEGVPTE